MTILHDLPRTKAAANRRSYYDLEEYDSELAAALRADMASGATAEHVRRVMTPHLQNDTITQWLYRAALYLESLNVKEAA